MGEIMKKTLAVLWTIIFAVALVSCSLFETESEMGTVVVDLGGTARSADPTTGLPILGTDGVSTHIRIFDESNRELLYSIQNSATASVMLAVGTKITVSVDIVTDSARWHGEGVHTVGSGSNATQRTNGIFMSLPVRCFRPCCSTAHTYLKGWIQLTNLQKYFALIAAEICT